MKNDFTIYDYKEVNVNGKKVSFYLDCYENFGWIPDENFPLKSNTPSVTLHLKRNRKIVNKTELTRLQRHFEACADELIMLEKSKKTSAHTISLTIGMIGTAFMAGSVFAITAEKPRIGLSVLLAIPAFIGWILPLVLYQRFVIAKAKKVDPFIEKKYDEIYEICQKGHDLL